MLILNNTPFVHARVYLQYLKSALPGHPPSLLHRYFWDLALSSQCHRRLLGIIFPVLMPWPAQL